MPIRTALTALALAATGLFTAASTAAHADGALLNDVDIVSLNIGRCASTNGITDTLNMLSLAPNDSCANAPTRFDPASAITRPQPLAAKSDAPSTAALALD